MGQFLSSNFGAPLTRNITLIASRNHFHPSRQRWPQPRSLGLCQSEAAINTYSCSAEVYRSAHVKMLQLWILDINTFISSYVYIHAYTSHYAYLCELISPHWGFVQAACVIYIHTDIHTYIFIFICHMYVYIIYNCIMSYHMYHLSIVLRVQGVPGKAVICTLMQYPI
jgi:hypothetical protein